LNLIGNALKFSPAGSTVRVGARPIRPGMAGSGVVFWVADRGPGIPEEEQPFGFQKYYRGSLAEKVDGAGLGLNISKRIVEAHGGEMRLLSRLGEGSIFSFHLPSTAEVG
jgi:signal transduction histidine kinase